MFTPSLGFMTSLLQKEFLDTMVPKEKHSLSSVKSLYYTDNNTDTLYFWQLYSLLGEDKIRLFIYNFYKRIFDDKEDKEFLETFIYLGDLKKHINGQTNFWLDCMGGGQTYPGGERKLRFHHSLAKDIMNSKGAERWLLHMRFTLLDKKIYLSEDPRVRPCIIEFINFFMLKYSNEFQFKYAKL